MAVQVNCAKPMAVSTEAVGMNCCRIFEIFAFGLVLAFACASPQAAWSQAGTITKGMQDYCVNDYK
jgi:hypothetical protein